MEQFFRWSKILCQILIYLINIGVHQAPRIFSKDMSKRKWTLTGTVGSGGFGLIYHAEEEVELFPCCKNQNLYDFREGRGANVL